MPWVPVAFLQKKQCHPAFAPTSALEESDIHATVPITREWSQAVCLEFWNGPSIDHFSFWVGVESGEGIARRACLWLPREVWQGQQHLRAAVS